MKAEPASPSTGAAQVVVPKKVVGMMFWIWGEPGMAAIVKVKTKPIRALPLRIGRARPPMVLPQPNASSISLRLFWLTA